MLVCVPVTVVTADIQYLLTYNCNNSHCPCYKCDVAKEAWSIVHYDALFCHGLCFAFSTSNTLI